MKKFPILIVVALISFSTFGQKTENEQKEANALQIVSTVVITLGLPLLTFVGVQKFFIEPRFEASNNRKKYATALYIACEELRLHLLNSISLIEKDDETTKAAMKMIPDNDYKGNPAWFVKWGYYTTITAYKIAAVSAWPKIYQNSLLFSSYHESREFLNGLYKSSQNLKLAFSTNTCLWYYYIDAVGERLIEQTTSGTSVITFAKVCEYYTNDRNFRLFFEQLHMNIWFLGDKEPRYLQTVPKIQHFLNELITFLTRKNLLSGLQVERSKTDLNELEKAQSRGWSGHN